MSLNFDQMAVDEFRQFCNYTAVVCGGLSLVCTLFAILYWFSKIIARGCGILSRFYSLSLIGFLTVFDLISGTLHGVDHLMSILNPNWPEDNPSTCSAIGLTFYLTLVMSWTWVFCIALDLAYLVRNHKPNCKPKHISIKIFLLICVGFAIILTAIIGAQDGFGLSVSKGVKFCLIKDSEKQFVIFYGAIPAWILWCLMVVLYATACVLLYYKFSSGTIGKSSIMYELAIKKSIAYPFLFLVVWLSAYLWSIWWYLGTEPRTLVWLMTLFANLNGTLNSLVYVFINYLLSRRKKGYYYDQVH